VNSVIDGGGRLPSGMSFIPNRNAIITADPATGFDIFQFGAFDLAKVKPFRIPGQQATSWITFSKKTGNFYLIVSFSFDNRTDSSMMVE